MKQEYIDSLDRRIAKGNLEISKLPKGLRDKIKEPKPDKTLVLSENKNSKQKKG